MQGEIKKQLSIILSEPIKLIAAGRTDTGVHASGQVANFVTSKTNIDITKLKYSLNSMLLEGIVIHKASIVKDSFHSRFDARERTYVYSISKDKLAIKRNHYCYLYEVPKVSLMKEGAKLLLGTHDFINISVATRDKSTICNMMSIDITETSDAIYIKYIANRYLHKMIRMTTGLLVEIGKGELGLDIIKKLFSDEPVSKNLWVNLPPHGLCLTHICY